MKLAALVSLSLLILQSNGIAETKSWRTPEIDNPGAPNMAYVSGALLIEGKPFSGTVVERRKDNTIHAKTEYFEGRREGAEWTWYDTGELESAREFKSGVKVGVHRGWHKNGQLRFEYPFEEGRYQGWIKSWYDDGRPRELRFYKDGEEEGSQQVWDPSGNATTNYIIKNGRRYGLVGSKPCVSISSK